jgi:hypothetical protein
MSLQDFFAKHDLQEQKLIAKHGHDYANTVRVMEVNRAEQDVIDAWLKSLIPEIMTLQGKDANPFGEDEPYYGAIGGGVTYMFTGTGLGNILIVKEATTGKELNVTQALDWFFFG